MILIVSSNIGTGTRKKNKVPTNCQSNSRTCWYPDQKAPRKTTSMGLNPTSAPVPKKCQTYLKLNGFDTGIYRGPMIYTLHVAACLLYWWLLLAQQQTHGISQQTSRFTPCVKRWGAGSFNFNRLSSFLLADVGPSYVFPYCVSTRKLMVVWMGSTWHGPTRCQTTNRSQPLHFSKIVARKIVLSLHHQVTILPSVPFFQILPRHSSFLNHCASCSNPVHLIGSCFFGAGGGQMGLPTGRIEQLTCCLQNVPCRHSLRHHVHQDECHGQ